MAINKQMVPWVLKLMKLGGWWGLTNLVPSISPTVVTFFLSVTSVSFHCCNKGNLSVQVLNLFCSPAVLMYKASCAFPWYWLDKGSSILLHLMENLCLLSAQQFCSRQPVWPGQQTVIHILQLPLWYGCEFMLFSFFSSENLQLGWWLGRAVRATAYCQICLRLVIRNKLLRAFEGLHDHELCFLQKERSKMLGSVLLCLCSCYYFFHFHRPVK